MYAGDICVLVVGCGFKFVLGLAPLLLVEKLADCQAELIVKRC